VSVLEVEVAKVVAHMLTTVPPLVAEVVQWPVEHSTPQILGLH
jgi:hypothetical protein